MPSKNPIEKIKDVATGAAMTVAGTVSGTVKDPIGTGQKVVGTAVGQAVAVAGLVGTKLPGRKRAEAPKAESRPVAEPQSEPRKDQGDPVKPAKKTAKKAPAKKAAAKKTATKKAPAKKAPAKKAADLATVEDSSVETPVGTTGADAASNPDTTESDLQQVGTEPLMDSSLTNAVRSEAETGARAADVEKG